MSKSFFHTALYITNNYFYSVSNGLGDILHVTAECNSNNLCNLLFYMISFFKQHISQTVCYQNRDIKIFLIRSLIQSADKTTGLVSITLFNVLNMGVRCRPHPRYIYFTTVYIVNYFLIVCLSTDYYVMKYFAVTQS